MRGCERVVVAARGCLKLLNALGHRRLLRGSLGEEGIALLGHLGDDAFEATHLPRILHRGVNPAA